MPLPEQIKAARLRLGLTQAEAAAVCGAGEVMKRLSIF